MLVESDPGRLLDRIAMLIAGHPPAKAFDPSVT
jgi:hypothetical protein